ncbi:primosomal replication protein PriC [Pantoea sp. 1.19]|uniref:primosomal replication protein PriC n=1 Tax=Pantoea sp. 1.19 TaxID=1925589 RepID=UPI000948F0EC|nr:primosomal replication protein [Pantoea sp. 1.19]
MRSTLLLRQLGQQVSQLAEAVAPVAGQRSRQARFDNQLFHSHSSRLGDYLQELQQTHQQLLHSVELQHTDQVRWLAERVVAQISALQRELATAPLRRGETADRAAQKTVYETLAEHQDFERRLLAMIADRESLLGRQAALADQRRLQQEIAALEGRLQRCRQALKRIEQAIERGER